MAISQPAGCLAAHLLAKEGAFHATANDSFLKSSGKFTARKAITISALCLAFFEMASSAIIATITSPAHLLTPGKYAKLTGHTAASANAVVQAAKRTFGVKPKQTEEEAKSEEKAPPAEPAKSRLQRTLAFAKKHETALTVATIATGLAIAYYGGLFDYTGNLFAIHSTPLPPEPVKVVAKAVASSASSILPICPAPMSGNVTTTIAESAASPAPLISFSSKASQILPTSSVCNPMTPWANATSAVSTTPFTFTPQAPSSSALTLYGQPLATTRAAATTAITTLPPLNFAGSDLATRFTPQAPAPLVPFTDKVSQLFANTSVCYPEPVTPWANATSAVSPSLTYTPQAPSSTALTLFQQSSPAAPAAAKTLPSLNFWYNPLAKHVVSQPFPGASAPAANPLSAVAVSQPTSFISSASNDMLQTGAVSLQKVASSSFAAGSAELPFCNNYPIYSRTVKDSLKMVGRRGICSILDGIGFVLSSALEATLNE